MPPESSTQYRVRMRRELMARLTQRLTEDLIRLARGGLFPAQWLDAAEIANRLEQAAYWTSHPEPLASFLPSSACVSLVGEAVAEAAQADPRAWWRDLERFRPQKTDWNETAADTALRLRLTRRDEERTAIFGGADEPSVIFANENHADPQVRHQIAALRDCLRVAGIPELAFATSPDGAAWVMLVWTPNEQLLQSVLLSMWTSVAAG